MIRPALLLADTHFANHKFDGGEVGANGINTRCAESLHRLVDVVRRWQPQVLIIAGDVFDSDRPPHAVVRALMDVLHGPAFESTMTYLMRGNHDMTSARRFDNALSPLAHAPGVTVVDEPALIRTGPADQIWLVPYGYNPVDMEPPPETWSVVAHHGIWGEDTPRFMRDAKGAVNADDIKKWIDKHGIAAYYAGDWHQHTEYHDGRVVQIGALAPLSFANPGLDYGSVFELVPNTVRHVVGGPRFVTAETANDLPKLPLDCYGYARVRRGPTDLVWPGYRIIEVDEKPEETAAVERAAADVSSPEAQSSSLHTWIQQDPQTPAHLKDAVFSGAQALLDKARRG